MDIFRLTSLELNGYKTFASRTRFEFAGSITAIVGPNGSGKSNIADSIRWVLGEQAISVLRGRKSEDMIFSGSEKRPKAGMASATVTFDNHDGWLPIDFSEVSITRRAYRDGQNEYLINQQKVRLRDINELLSQSSLAERTYTVIGQGLVDTALTLNSDERRRLFEEAAGIGLYRNRKDQSQKRLIETRRNLDRVADIMAELKPRLRSLERQAGRAEEHAVLRADLRENLRSWYGYQWHRAQDELLRLREAAESHEENLGVSRQKQSELTNELNLLRLKAQDLRVELNSFHRNLAELHAGREKSGRELAVSTERQRALKAQRQALQAENQRLKTEMAAAETRLQENQKEQSRIEQEIEESNTRMQEARQSLDVQLSVQEQGLEENRQRLDALSELRAQRLANQAQLEEINQSQERAKQELLDLEAALSELTQKADDLSREQSAIEAQIQSADASEQDLEKQLEALLKEQKQQGDLLQANEEKAAILLREQAKANAEIQALRESEASLEGFFQGAKKLLFAAKSKNVKLFPKTLGNSITVGAQFERAIASALGDYVDAVGVGSGRELQRALALLDGEDQSLALLPLESAQKHVPPEMPSGKGIVGPASEFVEVAKEFQAAATIMLSNVLIVEHRDVALSLRNSQEHTYHIVTLDGELFAPEGPVTVRSSKAASSMTRPRRMAELSKVLQSLESQLAEHQQKIDQDKQQASQIEQSLLALRSSLERASLARENLHRRKQSLSLENEQIERQMEWFSSQKRNAIREAEAAKLSLADLQSRKTTLEKKLAEAQESLNLAEPATELPLDDQRAQVAHWEMRAAVSQRALQEMERRGNEYAALIQHANEQMLDLEKRKEELNRLETELRQEESHLNLVEGDSGEEIAAIQSKIGPAEEELSRTESELRISQDAEREALSGLTSAERNHTQAQIALARQQEALSTLRGRIEDDFGLVAFEYDESVSGPTPLPLGDLVEHLPVLEAVDPDLDERLKQQRAQIRRLGSINPEAQKEYQSVKHRFEDMAEQVADLEAAEVNLKEVISELDVLMDREFRKTFETVAAEFRTIFSRLFSGGSARLILTDEADLTNTGIDIEARLPGKRSQRLALLSGGERSLTAAALIFALLKASPTPFCVMDEVDAMLDEANVGRFTELLRELSQNTQFVLITHNRNTVQVAKVIYGITMGRDTASQVISLKLDEVDERYSES